MTELAFPLALTRQNFWAGPEVVVWIVVETSEGFPRGLNTVIFELLQCNMQGNTTPGTTLKVDVSKYSGG